MSIWIIIVVLGIVEGITEFLPVSSTGHLIVIGDLLGFGGDFSKVFEVVIQLGAILAVCWMYRAKLWHAATTFVREPDSRHFVVNVTLAFLPAVVIGFFAHDFIKRVLFSPLVVAWAFIIGGIAILAVERWRPTPTVNSTEAMKPLTALKVGFFQCLAMIPGTSRSGATIVGALLLGVTREAATEFSFFLAIPTMAGATVLDVWKALPQRDFPNYAAGTWGPAQAEELLRREGREWRDPTHVNGRGRANAVRAPQPAPK